MNSGFLNIGITPTLAFHILHKILPKFMNVFPNIKINLVEGTSQDIENQVLEGKVDLCLNTLPLLNRNIQYTQIYTEPIYLVVPPQHHLYKRIQQNEVNSTEIMSLISHDHFIILKDRYGLKQIINKALETYDIYPNVILETSNVDNAHRLAISAGVLTFIPSSSIEHNSDAIYVELNQSFTNTVVIGYKDTKNLTKVCDEFISLTLKQFN
ncbi:LysR family transcriptional regulator substrate-binding protein [Staphylococcus sp. 18_1_E_LY]|uniref:LysR family transcriptional regulator substrate-binding protein n=1 Tax=Staphylococcus lloydii TaxID=2781774 RepID=A0A7T1B023_9STAP|nr:LysR family transcriptional regulator substrate-binding protein [Staphylococcus lloydii]MBF7019911.1 LysR family transcriptional regulator substrate-binding protein [Staphylococcus lloydii]MBF7027594.1 LysR family transcriptional regulator substrate-binding protein [Staphylococcus lloydii]QPM75281.1 LysR family transcriptional regulator substrate-binding protein [Staphylococcus lloydii]